MTVNFGKSVVGIFFFFFTVKRKNLFINVLQLNRLDIDTYNSISNKRQNRAQFPNSLITSTL